MGLTVRDMDETLKYWNGVLGLELEADKTFSNDAAMLDLMGLPKGASYRISGGLISGSKARIELIEIKGVPRKPFDLRVTDANACGMALRVGHIRDLLAKIKAAGRPRPLAQRRARRVERHDPQRVREGSERAEPRARRQRRSEAVRHVAVHHA